MMMPRLRAGWSSAGHYAHPVTILRRLTVMDDYNNFKDSSRHALSATCACRGGGFYAVF